MPPQLARLASDISFSDGGIASWLVSGGGVTGFSALDETIADAQASELVSPSTVATHTAVMAFGPNWDGTPLVRPHPNNKWGVLRVDARALTGATQKTITLLEGAVPKKTWGPFAINNLTYPVAGAILLLAIDGVTLDSIGDFTNLRYQGDDIVGVAGRRGGTTYVSLRLGSPTSLVSSGGILRQSFVGLTDLPRSWESFTVSTAEPTLPAVNNQVDLTADTFVEIFVCYGIDLPADQYALVQTAGNYDNNKMRAAAFVRLNPSFSVIGTDTQRYDLVPNDSAVPPAHELKFDGDAVSSVLSSVPFTVIPNIVAGDKYETRAIGSVVSGRKNGVEVTSFDDSARPALPNGLSGFLLNPHNGPAGPFNGIVYFETGATTQAPLVGGFSNPFSVLSERRRR